MEDLLARFFDNLVGRLHGPLTFRFILQPTMASILAIRAGLHDARSGRTAYAWTLFRDRTARRRLLKEGVKAVTMVFTVAIVIDALYQLIVFQWFYPGEAIAVAAVLAFLPYVAVRGPTNRIASRLRRTKVAARDRRKSSVRQT